MLDENLNNENQFFEKPGQRTAWDETEKMRLIREFINNNEFEREGLEWTLN